MGALQDKFYSPTGHHQSILQSVLEGSSVSNSLVRSYKRSFNGFAAKLNERERLKLVSMDGIVSVFPNKIYKTQTTRSWDFMGLSETIKRNPTVESDTIIGVIDTGIWPESESFSDEGFGPPPKKWKGACNGGENFTCNNKVIGARYYNNSFFIQDINSSRDDVGHGSHTASTAGGNIVRDASFYGIAKGSARGGVPSARIAAYKVCNANGCAGEAIMAAFDDAIADGVDIITLSLGLGAPFALDHDVIAICAFHAMEKGILTAHSAGNSGPTLGSVSSVAPWVMTVAASSTDRQILDKLVLGNGATIIGHSVNSFTLNGTTFPLGYGKDVKNASGFCSDMLAEICDFECLDSDLVKGKIVVCDFTIGSASGSSEALRAGALGTILPVTMNDVSFVVPLPVSHLIQEDYNSVLSYLNSTKDPQATILKSEDVKDSRAPRVASFSSRGPNLITPDIVKPDISAPGVDILAAYSYEVSPSDNTNDKRRVKYNIISGTSMACPHVAGAAAYVKTFHPHWSPSAIKSSLMTTAWLMNHTKTSNGEFDYGSGHINPTQAINPGLVFETKQEDYITFLCNSGYDEKKVRLISGDNSTICPKVKGSTLDLNYPSMSAKVAPNQPFKIEFNRRVKNVGHANSTYKPQIFSPSPSLIDIKVDPEELSFKSLNEEQVFGVLVSGSGLSSNSTVSASVVWSDGTHYVRSPIVLHNIVVG
ncbi:subtilisin-like protease SBT4.4 [Humulus lupulus]|uniref:subtilisin-like protease SBT4.4 n=1 Tax=Humulus lupulus TaxID=3486 RepID=UPI002B406CFB|nr:subtilisin-like protease SBT4.4 [Humulus lupulus]